MRYNLSRSVTDSVLHVIEESLTVLEAQAGTRLRHFSREIKIEGDTVRIMINSL